METCTTASLSLSLSLSIYLSICLSLCIHTNLCIFMFSADYCVCACAFDGRWIDVSACCFCSWWVKWNAVATPTSDWTAGAVTLPSVSQSGQGHTHTHTHTQTDHPASQLAGQRDLTLTAHSMSHLDTARRRPGMAPHSSRFLLLMLLWFNWRLPKTCLSSTIICYSTIHSACSLLLSDLQVTALLLRKIA